MLHHFFLQCSRGCTFYKMILWTSNPFFLLSISLIIVCLAFLLHRYCLIIFHAVLQGCTCIFFFLPFYKVILWTSNPFFLLSISLIIVCLAFLLYRYCFDHFSCGAPGVYLYFLSISLIIYCFVWHVFFIYIVSSFFMRCFTDVLVFSFFSLSSKWSYEHLILFFFLSA